MVVPLWHIRVSGSSPSSTSILTVAVACMGAQEHGRGGFLWGRAGKVKRAGGGRRLEERDIIPLSVDCSSGLRACTRLSLAFPVLLHDNATKSASVCPPLRPAQVGGTNVV